MVRVRMMLWAVLLAGCPTTDDKTDDTDSDTQVVDTDLCTESDLPTVCGVPCDCDPATGDVTCPDISCETGDTGTSETADTADSGTPPLEPTGDTAETADTGTPPLGPTGDTAETADTGTPPLGPTGDTADTADTGTPPLGPTGDTAETADTGTPPLGPTGDSGDTGTQPTGDTADSADTAGLCADVDPGEVCGEPCFCDPFDGAIACPDIACDTADTSSVETGDSGATETADTGAIDTGGPDSGDTADSGTPPVLPTGDSGDTGTRPTGDTADTAGLCEDVEVPTVCGFECVCNPSDGTFDCPDIVCETGDTADTGDSGDTAGLCAGVDPGEVCGAPCFCDPFDGTIGCPDIFCDTADTSSVETGDSVPVETADTGVIDTGGPDSGDTANLDSGDTAPLDSGDTAPLDSGDSGTGPFVPEGDVTVAYTVSFESNDPSCSLLFSQCACTAEFLGTGTLTELLTDGIRYDGDWQRTSTDCVDLGIGTSLADLIWTPPQGTPVQHTIAIDGFDLVTEWVVSTDPTVTTSDAIIGGADGYFVVGDAPDVLDPVTRMATLVVDAVVNILVPFEVHEEAVITLDGDVPADLPNGALGPSPYTEAHVTYTLDYDVVGPSAASLCGTTLQECDCTAVYEGDGSLLTSEDGLAKFVGTWGVTSEDCGPVSAGQPDVHTQALWTNPNAQGVVHTLRFDAGGFDDLTEWVVHGPNDPDTPSTTPIPDEQAFVTPNTAVAVSSVDGTLTHEELTTQQIVPGADVEFRTTFQIDLDPP